MPKSLQSPEISKARLSGLAPAIATLHALGLPAKRIAELFGTNSDYIHVLSHRGRKRRADSEPSDRSAPATTVTSLSDDDVRKAKEELKVRAEQQDAVELTPKRLRNLEWLESQMQDIADTGRTTYSYLQAVSSLKALKPHIGFPSDSNLLRIAGKLHQHLAWFYTHSGFASSCIAEASHSIRLYEIVYHDTEDKDALRELGGSCLIRSNSRLSDGSGEAALLTLKLSEKATLAAGIAFELRVLSAAGRGAFSNQAR